MFAEAHWDQFLFVKQLNGPRANISKVNLKSFRYKVLSTKEESHRMNAISNFARMDYY